MNQGAGKKYYFFFAAAMMLVLFAPGWSPDKFLFGLDTFTLHLPYMIYAKKVWAAFHDLPLWMPDIYMGMPSIDSANLMYFYPTNLLSVLLPLPVEQFYLVDMLIHMSAAAFGMFLFLRRHDIEKHAAYFGAFVYMFTGQLVTYAYNGHWPDIKAIALVPFVFYFINRAVREKKFFFYASAGLFMALQIMGIGMQVAAYTYISAAFYCGWLLYTEKAGKAQAAKTAALFAAAAVAAVVFSAPQFLTSRGWMDFSWRKDFSYGDFTDFSFNPRESIVFLLPQFFGLKDSMYWGYFSGSAVSFYCGLLPLLFMPFAFALKKYRNISVFFLVFTAFTAIMALGGFTPLYRILYHIPVFNKFRNPARFLAMLPLAMSFFAAAGLGSLMEKDKDGMGPEKVFGVVIKAAAALSGVLIFLAAGDNFLKGLISSISAITRAPYTSQPMTAESLSMEAALIREDVMYFTLICACFAGLAWLIIRKKLKSAVVIGLLFCSLQFIDMWRIEKKYVMYFTVKDCSPADAAASYMKNDKSVFRAADFTFTWTLNRSMYYGLEFFVGYHAILHNKMFNLLANDVYKYRNMLRLFNVKYYLNAAVPPEYAEWGLKQAVDGPVKLFEDPYVMPRVFLTDRMKKLAGDEEILAYMKTDAFDPAEALVKDDIDLYGSPEKLAASAAITAYSPNRIKISASANKETMLVLSNMYYYRWKVMVDKKPERIYNIDYCINGVKLKAGSHDIEFYYDRSFMVACILLMLAALAAYAALYFIEKRRKQEA